MIQLFASVTALVFTTTAALASEVTRDVFAATFLEQRSIVVTEGEAHEIGWDRDVRPAGEVEFFVGRGGPEVMLMSEYDPEIGWLIDTFYGMGEVSEGTTLFSSLTEDPRDFLEATFDRAKKEIRVQMKLGDEYIEALYRLEKLEASD